jgi:hypothetical protein
MSFLTCLSLSSFETNLKTFLIYCGRHPLLVSRSHFSLYAPVVCVISFSCMTVAIRSRAQTIDAFIDIDPLFLSDMAQVRAVKMLPRSARLLPAKPITTRPISAIITLINSPRTSRPRISRATYSQTQTCVDSHFRFSRISER